MLNKLNLNKMVCRLGVVALLLGLYYLLPIHEGFERKPKTSASYTTKTTSPKDKVNKLFAGNTGRRSRPHNNS